MAGGVIAAVVFIVFFTFMTTMILKRRRELDMIELTEDEVDDSTTETTIHQQTQIQTSHVTQNPVMQANVQPQTSPPGPMPGAPGPMPTTTPAVQPTVPSPNPDPSPQDFTDEQLMAAGWSQSQIQELRVTVVTQQEDAGAALPSFNCLVTGQVLTADDSWWQCPSCGSFASSVAIAPYTHCPACNAPR